MEKSTQRISLLLSILLFGGIFTIYSQSVVVRDNILYKLDEANRTALLYRTVGWDISGDLILPENINYDGEDYILESIGLGAFSRCTELTSIKLPKSIKAIGESAFDHCSGLKVFDFSENHLLEDMGGGAFVGCDKLVEIKCNSNFSTEGNLLYSGDKKRLISYFGKPEGHISIPQGVEVIEENALMYAGYSSVRFPSSLQKIKEAAFAFCFYLSSVDLSDSKSLKSIGKSAFSGCGIVNLLFPESLEEIGEQAFFPLRKLETVDFSKCISLVSIGGGAFNGCDGVRDIICNTNFIVENNMLYSKDRKYLISSFGKLKGELVVPDGVQKIYNYAFNYYVGLTSVKFPASLVSIGDLSFGASQLEMIDFTDCSLLEEIGAGAFNYNYISDIDLTKCCNLKYIGVGAFAGCNNLSDVDLSYCTSLLKIRYSAFEGSEKLNSVVFPSSLLEIEPRAFAGCKSLYNADLSKCDDLKTIKKDAFNGCNSLKKFDFSRCGSLIEIGGGVFSGCNDLSDIICNQYFLVDDNILYSKGKKILIHNWNKKNEIKLPKELEIISDRAFGNCSTLKNIDFSDCENLKKIGLGAFEYTGLQSVKLPKSVELIDSFAFISCENLEFIQMPGSLKQINCQAFINCYKLNEILFLGTKEPEFGAETFYAGSLPVHKIVYVPYAFSGFNASNWGDNVTIKYGQWPAGNKEVEMGSRIKVYGGKGSIKLIVSSSNAEPFSIFNPNGIEIYSGITEGELTIPVSASGMYIIRIGQQSWKVGVN